MKEACPAAAVGRQDKPSPDSGCSLGFNSSLSSPVRPAGDGETDRSTFTQVLLVLYLSIFLSHHFILLLQYISETNITLNTLVTSYFTSSVKCIIMLALAPSVSMITDC